MFLDVISYPVAWAMLGREAMFRVLAAVGVSLVLVGVVSSRPSKGSTSATIVRYVSPAGADSNSCTQSAPCRSFARAYQVASPGDIVEVAGGTYPSQTLPADASKAASSARVVFQPASGATVTIAGNLRAGDNTTGLGPKHFELRDLKVTRYVGIIRGTEDVILRNIDAGAFSLSSTRNVRIYGGDFGPWVDGVSHINACGVRGCFPAEDIVIDGALFHDYTISNAAQHSECLMIWPGRRVTIRNSTFRNCTDFDVLMKPYDWTLVGVGGEHNFENNLFDDPMQETRQRFSATRTALGEATHFQ